MTEKLMAEWFWTNRWMGSSAFLLPMEPRGLYREMLTQAWRRGARLPNDYEAIRRAVGCTAKEWARSWPKIERYWRVDGESLVNDTQLEVYAKTITLRETRSKIGSKGGSKTSAKRQQDTPPKINPTDRDGDTSTDTSTDEIPGGTGSACASENGPRPSRSPNDDYDQSMTDTTAEEILNLAEELWQATKRPPREWILRASRIEADARGPTRQFEDPRRSGLSEAWGQTTARKLREFMEQARRPLPL